MTDSEACKIAGFYDRIFHGQWIFTLHQYAYCLEIDSRKICKQNAEG